MWGAVDIGMFLLLYGARREGGLTAIRGILAREVTLQPNPVRDKLVRTLSRAALLYSTEKWRDMQLVVF